MVTNQRFVLVHGHFYQPPRENPWLEAVQEEDSAYPYHDWNERITDECYEPNTASRILNPQGQIARIVNNFAWMSFNVGPTLLAWLEARAPEVYRGILEGDVASRARFGGHGSALAQAYNHVILPLANARDRRTEIRWGVWDFVRRFGRRPEGMWLPETAVDVPTLEDLAAEGLQFTILAPTQAARCRPLGSPEWMDTPAGAIDTKRPYQVNLPSGRTLAVFFYDGPTSRAVAFEGLLDNGARFASRLMASFDQREEPQLVNIATDGESYGHHHRWGDMALAYALSLIDEGDDAALTNYGQFLELSPPTWEVEIVPNTSWSCLHGIERWRSDCGCNTGNQPGWQQAWRGPLRDALDDLANKVADVFGHQAAAWLPDPWAARDAYIAVITDRRPEVVANFLAAYARPELSDTEQVAARQALEMARHALLMFTSCGWFFDDISGLEASQVLRYAGRVLQLAQQAFGVDWTQELLERLAAAPSNVPRFGDGRAVFRSAVDPVRLNLTGVGAHAGMMALFLPSDAESRVYCYNVDWDERQDVHAARTKAIVGRLCVTSTVTGETAELSGAAVHWGDHNVVAAVRPFMGREVFHDTAEEVLAAFRRADIAAIIRVLDQHFAGATFNLTHLFRDEQRVILSQVLADGVAEAETAYGQVYDRQGILMRFVQELGHPVPETFRAAARFALADRLRRALARSPWNHAHIVDLWAEASLWDLELDTADWTYTLERTLARWAEALAHAPSDRARWERLSQDLTVLEQLPWAPDWRRLQNVLYRELVANAHGALRAVGTDTARRVAAQVHVAWPEEANMPS